MSTVDRRWMGCTPATRCTSCIYDFAPSSAAAVFEQWFAGAATDPAAGYTAEDYAKPIRTEHSTFRWLFEPMLTTAVTTCTSPTLAPPLRPPFADRRAVNDHRGVAERRGPGGGTQAC